MGLETRLFPVLNPVSDRDLRGEVCVFNFLENMTSCFKKGLSLLQEAALCLSVRRLTLLP